MEDKCEFCILLIHSLPFSLRLDSAALSPDLLSSVHTGDRVLEVNGIPVGNISPDEVGLKPPTDFSNNIATKREVDTLPNIHKNKGQHHILPSR